MLEFRNRGDTVNQDSRESVLSKNYASLPGQGNVVDLLGTRQLFKANAQQTAGSMLCAEISVAPGSGIPAHRHANEDEAFYVISGQVVIDGEDTGKLTLEAGSFFYGPRGRVHAFRNEGTRSAVLLVIAAPGNELGAMYDELAALLGKGIAIEPATLAEVCSRHGVHFVE